MGSAPQGSHLHLYRKYRPQRFAELVGQRPIQTTLKNEVTSNKVGHAYLLTGPRGLGKTSTARILAKAVNCEKVKDGEPDGTCSSCVAIAAGTFLDLIEIDAASHTGVDNVRENIIAHARVAPAIGKRKVFIIDEVHMLSISSFNALLKTLEEPPSGVLFILATTEVHKIPETILSRCERFDFKPIASEDMIGRLQMIASAEGRKVEMEVFEAIARMAEGGQRDAENFLDQVFSLDGKVISMDQASLVLPRSNFADIIGLTLHWKEKNLSVLFEQIQHLVDDGVSLPVFTKELVETWRKLLLLTIHRQVGLLAGLTKDPALQASIQKIVTEVSPSTFAQWMEVVLNKQQAFSNQPLAQLPLELAAVQCCAAVESPPFVPPLPTQSTQINPKMELATHATGAAASSSQSAPQPAAVSIAETVKASADEGGAGTARVMAKWAEILKECRKRNHALMLTLKVASVRCAVEGIIHLEFRYKFYRDRVMEPINRRTLEEVFQMALGRPIRIESDLVNAGPLPPEVLPPAVPQVGADPAHLATETQRESKSDIAVSSPVPEPASAWDMVSNTVSEEFTRQATATN